MSFDCKSLNNGKINYVGAGLTFIEHSAIDEPILINYSLVMIDSLLTVKNVIWNKWVANRNTFKMPILEALVK